VYWIFLRPRRKKNSLFFPLIYTITWLTVKWPLRNLLYLGMCGVSLLAIDITETEVHWGTDDTGAPTFTDITDRSMSVNVGAPMPSVLRCISVSVTSVSVIQYLHWHRTCLVIRKCESWPGRIHLCLIARSASIFFPSEIFPFFRWSPGTFIEYNFD
jgi:hypothetical protein